MKNVVSALGGKSNARKTIAERAAAQAEKEKLQREKNAKEIIQEVERRLAETRSQMKDHIQENVLDRLVPI